MEKFFEIRREKFEGEWRDPERKVLGLIVGEDNAKAYLKKLAEKENFRKNEVVWNDFCECWVVGDMYGVEYLAIERKVLNIEDI
ncbi:MAG: hypothetical protein IKK93_00340 [Campylobacter sp.]|nr:hypothetical protein [Campylobacter sp.]